MYNPSLREEPRNKTADVIPLKQEVSILDWLESTGRLIAREETEKDFLEEEEEISELMSGDDNSYDDMDDDSSAEEDDV
ncbi:MAG: DUF3134 domain-containing protein [Cyanobacteria bacterium J007]|nr:MAG: DUF3134 domain-containing protein [Cyanobacteria bacterium J007]